MTIDCLLPNTLTAACHQHGLASADYAPDVLNQGQDPSP